jgi:hypothetical protein
MSPQQEAQLVPLALGQARGPPVSPQQELEPVKKRLPEPVPPLAEQLSHASARALLPIPSLIVRRLLRQLLRPQHPSGARELSPPLPQSQSWNAFSFPLRQNPATGQ